MHFVDGLLRVLRRFKKQKSHWRMWPMASLEIMA
jgi:hypothetical protein